MTYSNIRVPSPSARFLLLLCSHALREKTVDAIPVAPVVILPNLLQGGWIVAGFQFGFEAVGKVTFRRDVGKEMREIRKVRLLRTERASERDGGRISRQTRHNQVHRCDGSHDLSQRWLASD